MKNKHESLCWCGGTSGSLFWGLLALALGFWFLAKDLGWISLNISIWPVLLIILGIWLISKGRKPC
mgnify:FL=1|jgi:hypothetical protein|tara:strand:- start:428 stop:625 length:198 start_codon:yes stop_codon:yes gene_type:complete